MNFWIKSQISSNMQNTVMALDNNELPKSQKSFLFLAWREIEGLRPEAEGELRRPGRPRGTARSLLRTRMRPRAMMRGNCPPGPEEVIFRWVQHCFSSSRCWTGPGAVVCSYGTAPRGDTLHSKAVYCHALKFKLYEFFCGKSPGDSRECGVTLSRDSLKDCFSSWNTYDLSES